MAEPFNGKSVFVTPDVKSEVICEGAQCGQTTTCKEGSDSQGKSDQSLVSLQRGVGEDHTRLE